jgi:hypothetical protein
MISMITCSSPPRHGHLDPVRGAEGHAGKGRDHGVGGEPDAESPGNGRKQQGRLHQGEVFADADPRAAAKGEVGVAVNLLLKAISLRWVRQNSPSLVKRPLPRVRLAVRNR